jgi:hypothetical protein
LAKLVLSALRDVVAQKDAARAAAIDDSTRL